MNILLLQQIIFTMSAARNFNKRGLTKNQFTNEKQRNEKTYWSTRKTKSELAGAIRTLTYQSFKCGVTKGMAIACRNIFKLSLEQKMKLEIFLKNLRSVYREKYEKSGYVDGPFIVDERTEQLRIMLLMILEILEYKIFDFFDDYDGFLSKL